MKVLFLFFFFVICISCRDNASIHPKSIYDGSISGAPPEIISLDTLPDQVLGELKPCDILIKPNLNFLPGTTKAPLGIGFGHAAIVIKGSRNENEAELLASVLTIESQARDVNPESQVRLVKAYVTGVDYHTANYNFNPVHLGRYYRLRLDLTDDQRDAVINYLLACDPDLSNSRAKKDYQRYNPDLSEMESHPMNYWYCSLLIWQAFYDVLGIDLDANKGFYVYPNDLINSPYFSDEPGKRAKRIRF